MSALAKVTALIGASASVITRAYITSGVLNIWVFLIALFMWGIMYLNAALILYHAFNLFAESREKPMKKIDLVTAYYMTSFIMFFIEWPNISRSIAELICLVFRSMLGYNLAICAV